MAKRKSTSDNGTEAEGRAVIERTPPIPDALDDRRRVEIICQQLLNLQHQAFELEVIQTANNRGDDDPVDGIDPDADGHRPTYGERLALFRSAEGRIAEAHPDLMPQVSAYLDGLRAAQTAQ